MSELEKWQSKTKSKVYVNKFDLSAPGSGRKVAEPVRSGRSFFITSEERNILNSDLIEDETMDPFRNGMFIPLLSAEEAAADAESIQAQIAAEAQRPAGPNPNHISDEAIIAMVKDNRNHLAFKKQAQGITSLGVAQRALELATSSEDADATVSQLNILSLRSLRSLVLAGLMIRTVQAFTR